MGAHEVMWDIEVRETDAFVIRKLLTDYGDFFKSNIIGKDVFITIRVPDPKYEKAESKLLIETLKIFLGLMILLRCFIKIPI